MKYEILKEIVESSHDGIYVTDGEGNTLFINNAYEKMTGIERDRFIGKNMKDLVSDGYFDISGSLMAIEKKGEVTLNQKTKIGKEILITSVPVFETKNIIKYVITNVRDITNLNILKKELEEMKEKILYDLELIIEDKKSKNLYHTIKKVSKLDTTILLEGETGTGKSMIAKIIHNYSERKNKNFIEINCGAIPKSLIESELFGYEGGAFTGGLKKGKVGIFELANESTLFLDEISELDIDLQVKLLKVIEDSYVRKVGGEKKIPINVRIIAATNENLKRLVDEKKFRKDLYYRLNVISLEIPSLKNRIEDIIPLSINFLQNLNIRYRKNKSFDKKVLEYFKRFDWPGNIRELKNIVEYLFATSSEDIISLENLPNYISDIQKNAKENIFLNKSIADYFNMSLKNATDKFQEDLILELLKFNKNQKKVAEILNVDPATISRKLKK